jgi:ABC-type transporter Mla MlaB component
MDGSSLPRLSYHFSSVNEDTVAPMEAQVMNQLRFVGHSKRHHKLIASNGWYIVAFDDRDASVTVLYESGHRHEVSCIHPTSGEVVFGFGDWDGFVLHSLDIATRREKRMDIPAFDGSPFWGLRPFRVIILPNQERIYFGHSGFGMDDVDEMGFCHVDAAGRVLTWKNQLEHEDDGFHGLGPWCKNDYNAIYDCDGYGLYRWSFDTHECSLLAGSRESWGCRDGYGAHARFWWLRQPMSNGKYLWVRTEGPRKFEWRVVRVNLETSRVETVRWAGINHDDLQTFWVTEDAIFVLQRSNEDPSLCKLLRASLGDVEDSVEQSLAMPFNLSEPVRPITFKLSGGEEVQVSGRTLVARSTYFREMLTSDFQEARLDTVDLTKDQDVDKAALSVLLHFVEIGNTWVGSKTDSSLAFRVRTLADRYCMPQLVYLADSILHGMLTEDTVLSFLGQVVGSGGALEDACWAMMSAARERILANNEHLVSDLVQQNPELAKKLILWKTGAEADPAWGGPKRQKVG